MERLLIRNGRVVDPASGTDGVLDVLVEGGKVRAIGAGLDAGDADGVIDASGLIVAPGLIDPHVHLREPGQEHKETIETGTAAAAAGGFTAVCAMPNTDPAIDTPEMVRYLLARGRETGRCRVFPVAAATVGRKGERAAEIVLCHRAGAVGFTDDGDVIASAGMMAHVLTMAGSVGSVVMQHCQEPTLTRGASMHAGEVSARLGLGGWPRVAEELIVERDIRLNRGIGCRYHVQHASSAGTIEIVRRARAEGEPVSVEASPHHLCLTHEAVEAGPPGAEGVDGAAYWTDAKMNPPLRERSDVEALRAGVADGTVTVLATDHAPHAPDEKAMPFEQAPFGIVGLETALGVYGAALVESGVVGWEKVIELMTVGPAALCGLDRMGLGRLEVGGPADVTLIDPGMSWTAGPGDLVGRSRNTPFMGMRLTGRAVATFVDGRRAFVHPSLSERGLPARAGN